jgi:4-amino-4-deoxy-L-arabinose transferase-like glycosyltransferase
MLAYSFSVKSRVLAALLLGLCALVLARVVMTWIWPVPLSVDEAQYLVWSRELQFGYYSKPPFVAWALSAAALACPDPGSGAGPGLFGPEGCVRWLQPLALGGAAFFVYATARALLHRAQIGVWAAVLFLLAPLAAFYSQAATTDAWLLLWWSASLWALVKAIGPSKDLGRGLVLGDGLAEASSQNQVIWWAVCGIFAGLGLLTKYSMAVFAVSALIVLVQRRLLLTPGPWLCGLMALLVFSPNLAWNAQWGWPTIAHHADITVGQDKSLNLAGLWNFFTAQWLTFSPLVFGMFLWGSLRRLGRSVLHRSPFEPETSQAISLLLAFTWPMLLVVMTQSALSRAHANWASPALVGMSLVVAAWWLANSASRGARLPKAAVIGLWGGLLINLVLSVALLASPWLVKELGLTGQRTSDPFVRLTGYKEAATVIGKLDPMPILASDDRKLLANLAAYLPKAQVYAFNPTGLKDNHWQLQRDLGLLAKENGSSAQQPVLLIQTRTIGAASGADSAGALADLEAIRLEGKVDLGVRASWITAQ